MVLIKNGQIYGMCISHLDMKKTLAEMSDEERKKIEFHESVDSIGECLQIGIEKRKSQRKKLNMKRN